MNRICVFCGSNPGVASIYVDAARKLGRILAKRKIGLVYGGASVGIMGELADAVLEEGGEVIGVIPSMMVEKEVAHGGLTDLRIVASMHERKALMAKLSDGFIALPGGLGTLEELFEVITWRMLGMHGKPCGLLNIGNYYDKLIGFLNFAVTEKFIMPQYRAMIQVDEDPEALLDRIESYEASSRRMDLDGT